MSARYAYPCLLYRRAQKNNCIAGVSLGGLSVLIQGSVSGCVSRNIFKIHMQNPQFEIVWGLSNRGFCNVDFTM